MDPLLVVIVLALIAVIITMMLGLATMGAGDSRLPPRTSTRLMWARVGLQGLAILLLFVAILLK
jgi:hypothetical protein